MAQLPPDGEQLDIYTVGKAEVTLLKVPGDIKTLYHLNPPEFKLTEDKYEFPLNFNIIIEDNKK